MTRPRFVLVGVPKAGTTSLHHYLGQHPGINVSPLDEVNFLSYPGAEVARSRFPAMAFRVTTIEAYDALFADTGDRVAVDFSASCYASDVAVARIKAYLSDPSLLVLLRDPCDRAYSAYLHRVRKGYEERSPGEALVAGEPTVQLGFYADRLSELRREFGPARVRAWLLDDIRADPAATLADIVGYLGADPAVGLDTASVRNQGSMPKSMTLQRVLPTQTTRRRIVRSVPQPLLRPARWLWERTQRQADPLPPDVDARLRALYTDDIRKLEALLDRDLSEWIEPRIPKTASG